MTKSVHHNTIKCMLTADLAGHNAVSHALASDSCGNIVAKFLRGETGTMYNTEVMCAKFYWPRPLSDDHTHFRAILYCHTY